MRGARPRRPGRPSRWPGRRRPRRPRQPGSGTGVVIARVGLGTCRKLQKGTCGGQRRAPSGLHRQSDAIGHYRKTGIGRDRPEQRGDAAAEGRQRVHLGERRQFVGDDALGLVAVHEVHQAPRDAHHGVLGVAAGGERIGLLMRSDRHLRHRQPGPLPQAIDHVVQLRRLLAGHDLGAVGAQRHLPGIEVHDEAHDRRDRQREQHAVVPAEHAPDDAEHRHHAGQQHEDLDVAHAPSPQGAPASAGPLPRVRADARISRRP